MQLCLLHLDDALEKQEGFIRTCESTSAIHVEAKTLGGAVRLWGKDPELEKLHDLIMPQIRTRTRPPRLIFMGSGDFRHISALLIANVLEQTYEHVTVIHFDNHPGWTRFKGGMHCGSWVNRALEHPQVTRVITVGVTSRDLVRPEWKTANLAQLTYGGLELYPHDHPPSRVSADYGLSACFDQKGGALHWRTIRAMGEDAFAEQLLARIPTTNVYLTIDKDVLARRDAITNWDQGVMRLPYLLSLIKQIGAKHRILGADVSGDYSTPLYHGDRLTRFMKQAEIYLTQPRAVPDVAEAIATNSATNHALLHTISTVMTMQRAPGWAAVPNSISPYALI